MSNFRESERTALSIVAICLPERMVLDWLREGSQRTANMPRPRCEHPVTNSESKSRMLCARS